MKIKNIFIHNEWTSECMLDTVNLKIVRQNDTLEGEYKIDLLDINVINIRWYNSDIFHEYITYDNCETYYLKQFGEEYIKNQNLEEYFIKHSEWEKICVFNKNKNILFKKYEIKEKGPYTINFNLLNVKWDLWGEESFVKIGNNYYQEKYLIDLIKSHELKDEYKLSLKSDVNSNIINKDLNKDINKDLNNDINKNLNKDTTPELSKFIIKNNDIIEIKDIISKINKTTVYYDTFKKIGNNYYFYSKNNLNKYDNINSEINDDINHLNNTNYINVLNNTNDINVLNITNDTNNYTYKIIDNISLIDIENNFKKLFENNQLNNINYLNKHNINEYIYTNYLSKIINNNNNNNIFKICNKIIDDNAVLTLDFDIKDKDINKKNNLKRCLTIADWGYPPFGGGENWLLTMNKIFNKNGYDNYFICFCDPFKNNYYDKIKMIDLNYVKIIQMPKDLMTIIKIIKLLNPEFINHQGSNRIFYMKISNILEIPFLTGFCFWQNIIKFNGSNINLNMISNQRLEKTDEFRNIIKNSYTYVASNFVNDIIYKFYNLKLDLIETISIKDDFYVKLNFNEIDSFNKIKYVTIINCHYNKGGYLLKYLCENLDFRIPLQIIYTEHDPVITIDYVQNLINQRNKKNDINIFITEKINIKLIYIKTRILLIPSLCEETFCRVAYEGMINKIPILSTKNGNLKYLLKDYALFINEFSIKDWKLNIEDIYFDKEKIISYGNNTYHINDEIIENQIMEKISSINSVEPSSKYLLNDKNIGMIIPWADQGLGIQGRDYYITLKNIGYNPIVFSFKPYHCTHDNLLLQTDKEEWNYENIYYSKNYRENIELDEIIDFIYLYNIKKIIIIEATYNNIFKISYLLNLLGIKLYTVVNIECARIIEINYHDVFNKILTNNNESFNIINTLYPNKTYNLGFHLNHPYFSNTNYITEIKKTNLKRIINDNIINFCCIGGFNSISRKNINLIIQTFYNIYRKNYNTQLNKRWILNVYIQGVEIPEIINEYQCENINYHIANLSYKEIVNKYINNDIFIHMGSHEGLGLGFYEALYCGTPLLTMNWTPNNEIIQDKVNGWLIECDYSNVYDNDLCLINQGIIKEYYLKDIILSIIENMDDSIIIIKNVINNIDILQKKNKIEFEKRFLNILAD